MFYKKTLLSGRRQHSKSSEMHKKVNISFLYPDHLGVLIFLKINAVFSRLTQTRGI